jgi:hypothetical protein
VAGNFHRIVEPGQFYKFSFTRGKGLDLPHLPNCPHRCWEIALIVFIGAVGIEAKESVQWPRTWGLVRLGRSIK